MISGGASGVDTAAADAARARGLDVIVFQPMWGVYGKSAGYKRNIQIVEASDRVVAFWDGTSKGTQHSINIAKEKNKPVEIIL